MNKTLQLLDVVALLEDHPEAGLVAGQVGTLVEQLADGALEVEFSDDEGRTYAEVALPARLLIGLRYSPVAA